MQCLKKGDAARYLIGGLRQKSGYRQHHGRQMLAVSRRLLIRQLCVKLSLGDGWTSGHLIAQFRQVLLAKQRALAQVRAHRDIDKWLDHRQPSLKRRHAHFQFGLAASHRAWRNAFPRSENT